jgi:hypothetical protein
MSITKTYALVAGLSLGAIIHAAPNPVGSWTGGFRNMTAGKNMPAAMKQQFEAARQKTQQMKISLVLRANHTYSTSLVGGNKKAPPQNGQWAQSGNKITMSVPNKPGSPVFILSPDGKTLTNHLSTPNGSVDVIFTR